MDAHACGEDEWVGDCCYWITILNKDSLNCVEVHAVWGAGKC